MRKTGKQQMKMLQQDGDKHPGNKICFVHVDCFREILDWNVFLIHYFTRCDVMLAVSFNKHIQDLIVSIFIFIIQIVLAVKGTLLCQNILPSLQGK